MLCKRLLAVLFIGASLAAGCSALSEKQKVKNDFLKDHPDYSIVSVGDADGNDTTVVTFFIVYKKPGDPHEFWADWAYETKNGKLELVGKGRESIFSPTGK